MSTIGERIEKARINAGLKQVDLQKACGVSSGMTTQWKDADDIKARNALNIAKVCNVRIEWLVFGEEPMEPKTVKDFTILRDAVTKVLEYVFETNAVVNSNRIADAVILNYKELLADRQIPVETLSNIIKLDDHR